MVEKDELLERIRTLCRKNNTSIKQLEEVLGFSNGSLAKATSIKTERIEKICQYFDIDISTLISENSSLSDNIQDARLNKLMLYAEQASPEDVEYMTKKFATLIKDNESYKNLPETVKKILDACNSMNAEGQETLLQYAEFLAQNNQYKKDNSPAMVAEA